MGGHFSCSFPSLLGGDIITFKQKQCAHSKHELNSRLLLIFFAA